VTEERALSVGLSQHGLEEEIQVSTAGHLRISLTQAAQSPVAPYLGTHLPPELSAYMRGETAIGQVLSSLIRTAAFPWQRTRRRDVAK
jgi:hypothetical protein